jgi:hypothetical protein
VIAESWPHLAIILYRVRPNSHQFLSRVFLSATICTAFGTVIETAVVMWLFGSLWARWSLTFKVVTPILHVVFSAAQVWGTWNFWKMYCWQRRCIRRERGELDAEIGKKEGSVQSSDTVVEERVTEGTAAS